METQKMLIKLGSIENTQGEVWDHQGKTEVAEIFISYGDHVINFVQFLYVENECLVLSERQGSTTIGKFFTLVKLNYPDEFLTSITGTCGLHAGRIVVKSITFGTNQGVRGPFGNKNAGVNIVGDTVFNFLMGKDRQCFGGFHGSTIKGVLESIGVYVKPTTTPRKT
ncbi:hypothetical protein RHSIM_Rhsim02G0004300 [Rhododendron simsii]|uniref:Jacalin-type lectin domain-containing protein n=1 Tax=Rhododendron simsii TaxID=118357 RepID=A0A834LTD6_RHOSS|nr:hypothetical protein RHSIM_Rhsim02G0004300 [Rhododendron simsii]